MKATLNPLADAGATIGFRIASSTVLLVSPHEERYNRLVAQLMLRVIVVETGG